MKKLKDMIKVGDVFFLVKQDSREIHRNGLQVVTKVGNKYFFVKPVSGSNYERKFELNDNKRFSHVAKEVTEYGSPDQLFFSEDDYFKELEWRKISYSFSSLNLSDEDREKIHQICKPYIE